MKSGLFALLAGALLASTALAGEGGTRSPSTSVDTPSQPPPLTAREIFGVSLAARDGIKLAEPLVAVAAACVCEEWGYVTVPNCQKWNDDGTQCLKWGTPKKLKCCARTSCGASECD